MVIAVIERDSTRLMKMREWLVCYALQYDRDFELICFTGENINEAIKKYVLGINIVFISYDCEYFTIGQNISRLNPECLLCYFGRNRFEMKHVIHSRPFEFMTWSNGENVITEVMNAMWDEYIHLKATFTYHSRRIVRQYSIRNILYFQSDLKQVIVRKIQAENSLFPIDKEDRLYIKLSEIEDLLRKQQVFWHFLRIHKSYLVNLSYISSVNKQNHTVRLASGEELPVSESHYKSILEKLRITHSSLLDMQ